MKSWLMLVFWAAATGCVGQGTGQVEGAVHIVACDNRNNFDSPNYRMDPDFFVGDPIEDINQDAYPQNRLEIRIQASSGNLGNATPSLENGAGIDALFVSIRDVRWVAQQVGQPIPMSALDVNYMSINPPPIRAYLSMAGTCPFSPNRLLPADSDAGVATITFQQLGKAVEGQGYAPAPDFKVDYGEDIRATFDLTLTDLRYKLHLSADSQASGHITGNFEFTLRRGAAGQAFP
jgi:hypothetical protein